MYNYGMNMFQPFGNQQTIVRVNGIDGAKAYQTAPNSTVALFDGNEDVFYVKATDGAGFPTIRTFRFTEVKEMPTESVRDYISREEFEAFKKEVSEYGKQSVQSKPTGNKQKSNE